MAHKHKRVRMRTHLLVVVQCVSFVVIVIVVVVVVRAALAGDGVSHILVLAVGVTPHGCCHRCLSCPSGVPAPPGRALVGLDGTQLLEEDADQHGRKRHKHRCDRRAPRRLRPRRPWRTDIHYRIAHLDRQQPRIKRPKELDQGQPTARPRIAV
jgi:hypothetical protein